MPVERQGATKLGERPLTVLGQELTVGAKAPDFSLPYANFSENTASLHESDGKIRIINVVPSLETGICDAQTRRFNEEASQIGPDVVVLTVSADLPYTGSKWCGSAGVDRVKVLSDHMAMSFGDAYGTHIKEFRIEQRAVFVVDPQGVIRYVEYCPAIGMHPNYDQAMKAVADLRNK